MTVRHEWECDGCGLEVPGTNDGERPDRLWEVKVRIEAEPTSFANSFRVDDLCIVCLRKLTEQSNPQNWRRASKARAAIAQPSRED